MFVVDLECASGHRFEGWYDSHAEYQAIAESGSLSCPLCESHDVVQVLKTGGILSAPRETPSTGPSAHRPAGPEGPPPGGTAPTLGTRGGPPVPSMPLEIQKALARFVQHVRRTHEDVGDAFAHEALSMHRGESPPRPIMGTSSDEAFRELRDEGVPVMRVPIPDIEQN